MSSASFEYITAASPAQLCAALLEHTSQESRAQLHGVVSPARVSVSVFVGKHNDFELKITGTIEPHGEGGARLVGTTQPTRASLIRGSALRIGLLAMSAFWVAVLLIDKTPGTSYLAGFIIVILLGVTIATSNTNSDSATRATTRFDELMTDVLTYAEFLRTNTRA